MNIFYDPTDGVLLAQDENCEYEIVKTNAQLDPSRIKMDQEGHITFYGIDGQAYPMKDEYGNLISLKGPKGDPGPAGLAGAQGQEGQKGESGKNADKVVHLELSNDMDLVYVNANSIVFTKQLLLTAVTLYEDNTIIEIGAGINEAGDYWELSVPNSDHTVSVAADNKVSLLFNKDSEITWTSKIYQIKASLKNKNGEELGNEVIKDFKVKRIQGTVDYDLIVSPGFIKIGPDDAPLTNKVLVKIKQRDLNAPESGINYITPQELYETTDQNYWISYNWRGMTTADIKLLDANSIDLIHPETGNNVAVTDQLIVKLNQFDGGVLDLTNIEFVKDGIDGAPGVSSLHLELSNDYDQIYVVDDVVLKTQSYEIIVKAMLGHDPQHLNVLDVKFIGVDGEILTDSLPLKDSVITLQEAYVPSGLSGAVAFKFDIEKGTQLTEGAAIKVGFKVNDTTKQFTLVVLRGTKDYDLIVSPECIKAISNEGSDFTLQDIKVQILEKEIGPNSSLGVQIKTLPELYNLLCSVDGSGEMGLSFTNGQAIITPNDIIKLSGDNTPLKVTISLYNENNYVNPLVDWAEVAILYDGKKGDKGDSGASSYYVDVLNDFDQIYRKDGSILPDLTFETELYLYHGGQLVMLLPQSLECISCPYGSYDLTIDDYGVGHIKLIFDGLSDLNDSNLLYKFKVTQTEQKEGTNAKEDILLYTTVRIAILDGTDDFDLKSSKTTIAKDSTGQLLIGSKQIDFWVAHKDLSATKVKITDLTTFDEIVNKGLALYVSCDGDTPLKMTSLTLYESQLKNVNEYISVTLRKVDGNVELDHMLIDVIKDGQDAVLYNMDLSNDVDLLYVDSNNKLVSDINIETVISVFYGSDVYDLNKSDIKLYHNGTLLSQYSDIPSAERGASSVVRASSVPIDGVGRPNLGDLVIPGIGDIGLPGQVYKNITYTLSELTDGRIYIKLIFEEGSAFTAKTTEYIDIEVTVTDSATGNNIPLQKRLKLKVFQDTEDYDLKVLPNTVVYKNTGEYSPDNITVELDKTSYGSNITHETNVELPDGWTLTYTVNGAATHSDIPVVDGKYQLHLSTLDFNNVDRPIVEIWLTDNDDNERDHEIITFAKDGISPSAYFLNLSNDLDQLFVNENNELVEDMTISTTLLLFNGTSKLKLSEESISIDGVEQDSYSISSDGETDKIITLLYKKGSVISKSQFDVTFNVTVADIVIQKTLKVKVLKGSISYDLNISHGVFVKDKNLTFSPEEITISVNKTTYGDNAGIEKCAALPEGYSLYYLIDDGLTKNTLTLDSENKVVLKPNSINAIKDLRSPVLTVVLLDNHNEIIDQEQIPCVSDGQDGVSNSYVLDFSNDSDQLYIDETRKIKNNESIKIKVKAFSGTTLLTLDQWQLSSNYSGSSEAINQPICRDLADNAREIEFTFDNTKPLEDGILSINYPVIATIGGIELLKTFKLYVFTGLTDYDLETDFTRIKIDKDGNISPKAVTVKVRKRDLSDGVVSYIKGDGTDGLCVYGQATDTNEGGSTLLTWKLKDQDPPYAEIIPNVSGTANKLVIDLKKNGTLIDKAIVDYIYDGTPGDSPYIVDLSTQSVNVTVVDGFALANLGNLTFDCSVFEGQERIQPYNLSATSTGKGFAVSNQYDSTGKKYIFTITLDSETAFEDGVITINATPVNGGTVITKQLYVYGEYHYTEYKINIDPQTVIINSDGSYSNNEVIVSAQCSVIGKYTTLYENIQNTDFYLTYTKDDDTQSYRVENGKILLDKVKPNSKIIILLLKNGSSYVYATNTLFALQQGLKAEDYAAQFEALEERIFKADGNLDDDLVNAMMLLVGADSMNYELENVKSKFEDGQQKFTGIQINNSLLTLPQDTLTHHLYKHSNSKDPNKWNVAKLESYSLEPGIPYYISVKCIRTSNGATWICSKAPYTVDQDKDYWYFNWGILLPLDNDSYKIFETRGNSYMYGDNLVCGKISTMDSKSYFDLTNGTFKLGENLEYTPTNGLVIRGSGGDLAEIQEKLGVLENREIGGTNLLDGTQSMWSWKNIVKYRESVISTTPDEDTFDKEKSLHIRATGGTEKYKVICDLGPNWKSDQKYTLSFDILVPEGKWTVSARAKLGQQNQLGFNDKDTRMLDPGTTSRISFTGYPFVDNEGNGVNLQLWFGATYFDSSDPTASNYGVDIYIKNLKLEYGDVATAWSSSENDINNIAAGAQYLTEILQPENTTEINGGLVLTNVIALKDTAANGGSVNAGLSGVKDDNVLLWGGATYTEACNAAKDNNDFYKKTNKQGEQITTLVKKDGTGKIGIFKISKDNGGDYVEVKTKDGSIIIDPDDGISLKNSEKEVVTLLTPGSIRDVIPQTKDDDLLIDYVLELIGEKYRLTTVDFTDNTATFTFFMSQLGGGIFASDYPTQTYGRLLPSIEISFDLPMRDLIERQLNITMNWFIQHYSDNNDRITLWTGVINTESIREQCENKTYNNSEDKYTYFYNHPVPLYTSAVLPARPSQKYEMRFEIKVSSGKNMLLSPKSATENSLLRLWYLKGLKSPKIDTPKTIIGKDGIVSAYNEMSYFQAFNADGQLRILVKGLPQGKPFAGFKGFGMMYRDKLLLATLSYYFEKVSDYWNGDYSVTTATLRDAAKAVQLAAEDTELIAYYD